MKSPGARSLAIQLINTGKRSPRFSLLCSWSVYLMSPLLPSNFPPPADYRAMCDLWDASTIPAFLNVRFPKGNQATSYFSDDNLRVSFPQADMCPLAISFLGVDCTREETDNYQSQAHHTTYLGEGFGASSRCVNAFSDISTERNRRIDRPACMHVECDFDLQKVVLGTGDFQQVCQYDGQVLRIPSSEADFLVCPRLATVCPQLFCPESCRGRGVCDYNATPQPKCRCFDPDNKSEECGDVAMDFSNITSPNPRVSKQHAETTDELLAGPSSDGDASNLLASSLPSSALGHKELIGPFMTMMMLRSFQGLL